MPNFNWLHLSDLHFHPNEGFDILKARKGLLKCLRDNNIHPTYIFITGDIADRGKYANVNQRIDDNDKGYIDEIIHITQVPKSNIFWAVGNHDISRDDLVRKTLIRSIRKSDPKFETAFENKGARRTLIDEGMKDYAEKYKELFDYMPIAPHRYIDLPELNLVILNTCLTSCDDNDEHQLRIINTEIESIFSKIKDRTKPVFVIGHHGRAFFEQQESKNLDKLFDEKTVDFYLCGHEHKTCPKTAIQSYRCRR